jgi:hypothetical protein
VPSSAIKALLLDDEQLTFNLPPIAVDMTEHSLNSEEESLDGDAVITMEGGIIDLTKTRMNQRQYHQ